MSASDVIAGLSLLVAALSALYARHAWSSTRQAMLQQALVDLHATYSSPEMLDAVRSLWAFCRQYGKDGLVTEYARQWEADGKALDARPAEQRLEFLKTTLHHKRRVVSHFYHHLAHLYVNNIMPGKVLYSSW